MKLSVSHSVWTALLLASSDIGHAFTTPAARSLPLASTSPSAVLTNTGVGVVVKSRPAIAVKQLMAAADSETDDEIERLQSMAAKLRAEAAALEAEQSKAVAEAAERAFKKFDLNQDGNVSVQELKKGLEKEFKQELPEKRVQQLMDAFDKSGDGALQLDEFVGVDQFRNRLDALARDERAQALEKAKLAKAEEAVAQALQEQVSVINDKPPSATDKLVSILPYLFPLLDGFQYARFLVLDNPDNLLAVIPTLIYALYRSIPFGGFIAFFVLYSLAGRPGINRLVRYNMQQAIFFDIALFFPGLFSALIGLAGIPLPTAVTALSSDALFLTLLATVGYCVVSSLLGITPDKVPFISEAVNVRVPTADSVLTRNEQIFSQFGVDLKLTKDDDADDNDKKKVNGAVNGSVNGESKDDPKDKVDKD